MAALFHSSEHYGVFLEVTLAVYGTFTGDYRGYIGDIGIMEKKMETFMIGLSQNYTFILSPHPLGSFQNS